jgi:hypothetical protein
MVCGDVGTGFVPRQTNLMVVVFHLIPLRRSAGVVINAHGFNVMLNIGFARFRLGSRSNISTVALLYPGTTGTVPKVFGKFRSNFCKCHI